MAVLGRSIRHGTTNFMMPRNRWRKLKWMGCVKYSKSGKPYIDKNKLDMVTGYIPTFSTKNFCKSDGENRQP